MALVALFLAAGAAYWALKYAQLTARTRRLHLSHLRRDLQQPPGRDTARGQH